MAILALASALIATYTATWFNRIVVDPKRKQAGYIYTSRAFTLHELANGAHNPDRFGDAATVLLIGAIILAGAAVVALIARSRLHARAVAATAMFIGSLLVAWGWELAKTPLPSRTEVFPATLWEGAGAQGAEACEAAAVLGLIGSVFAILAWRRASWFEQRWGPEATPSDEGETEEQLRHTVSSGA